MIGKSILGAIAVCLLTWPALAGTQCSEKALTGEMVAKAVKAATATYDALENSGAEVAILARVGADISEHGLRYTHAGFALRDHPKGRWFVRHQLNVCATDRSGIYDQGLLNFYLDDLLAYEALAIIPTPSLQRRVAAMALSPNALRLHHQTYSMIANPFSTKYQNSNQWVLEILALAQAPTGLPVNRRQAQTLLRRADFRPTQISISPFKVLGASLFRANVRFDDHGQTESDNGRYNVVSVGSVREYLRSRGEISRELLIKP